jgi:hypothetical protein
VFTRRKRSAHASTRPAGDRRRATRGVAGWDSRYLVDDPDREQVYVSDSDYTDCVLRDLSTAGVGFHSTGAELEVGDRLLLDLRLGERLRASIRVTGEVRHAAADEDGVVSAGVEFVEVGDLERALLLRLVRDLEPPRAENS